MCPSLHLVQEETTNVTLHALPINVIKYLSVFLGEDLCEKVLDVSEAHKEVEIIFLFTVNKTKKEKRKLDCGSSFFCTSTCTELVRI